MPLLSRFKEPETPSKSDLLSRILDKRSERNLMQEKLNEMDAVIEDLEDELNHM